MIMKYMEKFKRRQVKIQFHLEKRRMRQKKEERGFQFLYKIIGTIKNKITEEIIKVQYPMHT